MAFPTRMTYKTDVLRPDDFDLEPESEDEEGRLGQATPRTGEVDAFTSNFDHPILKALSSKLQWLQPYFSVNSDQILDRVQTSVIPLRFAPLRLQMQVLKQMHLQPDLYGLCVNPILLVTFAIAGMDREMWTLGDYWSQITHHALLTYSYIFLMSVAVKVLIHVIGLFRKGGSVFDTRQAGTCSLVALTCIQSYAICPWILVLLLLQQGGGVEVVEVALIVAGAGASSIFLGMGLVHPLSLMKMHGETTASPRGAHSDAESDAEDADPDRKLSPLPASSVGRRRVVASGLPPASTLATGAALGLLLAAGQLAMAIGIEAQALEALDGETMMTAVIADSFRAMLGWEEEMQVTLTGGRLAGTGAGPDTSRTAGQDIKGLTDDTRRSKGHLAQPRGRVRGDGMIKRLINSLHNERLEHKKDMKDLSRKVKEQTERVSKIGVHIPFQDPASLARAKASETTASALHDAMHPHGGKVVVGTTPNRKGTTKYPGSTGIPAATKGRKEGVPAGSHIAVERPQPVDYTGRGHAGKMGALVSPDQHPTHERGGHDGGHSSSGGGGHGSGASSGHGSSKGSSHGHDSGKAASADSKRKQQYWDPTSGGGTWTGE